MVTQPRRKLALQSLTFTLQSHSSFQFKSFFFQAISLEKHKCGCLRALLNTDGEK